MITPYCSPITSSYNVAQHQCQVQLRLFPCIHITGNSHLKRVDFLVHILFNDLAIMISPIASPHLQ